MLLRRHRERRLKLNELNKNDEVQVGEFGKGELLVHPSVAQEAKEVTVSENSEVVEPVQDAKEDEATQSKANKPKK